MNDKSLISVRGIPGFHQYPGRRYLYIELPSKAALNKFIKTDTPTPGVPLPKGGGMITENVILTTPDRRTFCGVSFQGDIDGWDRWYRARAKILGHGVAIIDPDKAEIIFEGGTASLAGCVIKHY